ncbi:acyl-CoA thioesterase [Acinetobacter qingfengensis]|uniref:4-hydroxybenzoyl-CoA thioesterase n=1 Tax=Acinetobacter qingfengensis TaxID=1262585 RepID=A0A1E7R2X6_9GAMM|nr:thioesterase family protein [Acinetobacter qingfengensis]KAA8733856.1 acyl-CoA thioesterase [Acinetobacter qingfengensis]OEY93631.1 4-hydroxybenzoyl-CoA thioesterase [Acinetobacter qingfengensis]
MRAEVEIDIPFHDVDSMDVVWHGHYLKYFEVARCQLLDQFGYNYQQMKASGYAWPIIESYVRYAHGIVFAQRIKVVAILKEWENRLKIDYQIYDLQTRKRLTRGYTTQVAVDMTTRELCYVSPAILLEKLQQWPAFQDTSGQVTHD